MNRNILIAAAAAAALTAGTAAAGARGDGYFDHAKVTRVEPLVEVVRVPYEHEECWQEEVVHRGPPGDRRSWTAPILGGIVGGVVGNQFGAGSGKDAMTVAGAVLGASVGNDLRHRPPGRTYTTLEERCELVRDYREEERIEGYRVHYRYHGRDFVTRLPHDPGNRLRVHVDVAPAE